jgi:hypothetical protein
MPFSYKRECTDFENCFNKHFVPEVWAFLKERGLPQKAVSLLDNAPSHQRHSVLTSNDGLIVVKFLPPSVNVNGPRSDCIQETMLLGMVFCE